MTKEEQEQILSGVKPLVSDPMIYKGFLAYIEMSIDKEQNRLEIASDPKDFYRCQGTIKALRKLKQLRDEVLGADGK